MVWFVCLFLKIRPKLKFGGTTSINRTSTSTSTHPETGKAVNALWDFNEYVTSNYSLHQIKILRRRIKAVKKMLLLMILTLFLNCSDAEKTKEVESRA